MSETSRGRRSAPVARWKSLSIRSSGARPTNGASSCSIRPEPPRRATTRSARYAGTGAALPFSTCSPAGSKAIASAAAWYVVSPTRTIPGWATDWSRDAVLTRSPATIPWFVAPSVTAASPVSTPARNRSSAPTSSPSASTAATRSRALRTARSASSSKAVGAPHTAITASPMNFSMVPPYEPMICAAVAKYRSRSSRTVSASRDSERVVKPTRSANRIDTRRRSAVGVPGSPGAGVAPALRRSVPHSPQNLTPGALDVPHVGQAVASGVPHSPQNFLPGSFVVPQTGQSNRISCPRVRSIGRACGGVNGVARPAGQQPALGGAIYAPVVRHRRPSRRRRILGPLSIGFVAFAAIGLIVAGNGASPKPVGAVAGETGSPSRSAGVSRRADPTAARPGVSIPPMADRSPTATPQAVEDLSGYPWPLANARLTLPFGPTPWGGWLVDGEKFHDGIDLATFCGDKVVAAHDGVILAAGRRYDDEMGWIGDLSTYYARLDAKKLWGTLPIVVVIDDGNGYRSVYAHFGKIVVKKGQTVEAGTLLGYEGRTGRASGCHLHYGLFDPSAPGVVAMGPGAVRPMRRPGGEIPKIDPELVLPGRSRVKPKSSVRPPRSRRTGCEESWSGPGAAERAMIPAVPGMH